MKRTVLEKKFRQKLAAQGVTLEPGSRAEHGVKIIAKVGADFTTTGERALRETRDGITRAAEAARDAIHNATKPPPRRRKK